MASTVAAPMAAEAAPGRARAGYARVAALGLVFIALVPISFIVGILAYGGSLAEDGAFFGGVAVIALVGAALVWKLGLVGRILGLVASVLAGGAIFWSVFGLFAPASIADFVPAVLWLLGILMGIGGSVASLVSGRGGRTRVEASPGERRILRVATGIVALAVVFSAVMTFTGRTSVDAAAAAGAVPVGYFDFEFAEETYTATAGEPVKFVVHNGDSFVHDFTVPALDVEPVAINPGSDKLVEFTAPAGTYLMFCSLHSDITDTEVGINMAATLVVE